jgi:hypothetical protein
LNVADNSVTVVEVVNDMPCRPRAFIDRTGYALSRDGGETIIHVDFAFGVEPHEAAALLKQQQRDGEVVLLDEDRHLADRFGEPHACSSTSARPSMTRTHRRFGFVLPSEIVNRPA